MGTVGLGVRAAFAMQESNTLHPFGLGSLRGARRRLVPIIGFVPVSLRRTTTTARRATTARTFRSRCRVVGPGRTAMAVRSGSRSPVLRGRRGGIAMTRGAAIFPRQRNADQFFDVAQIAHFLSSGA